MELKNSTSILLFPERIVGIEVASQYKGSPYRANIALYLAMLQTLIEYRATIRVIGSKDWPYTCRSEDAAREVQLGLR